MQFEAHLFIMDCENGYIVHVLACPKNKLYILNNRN